MKKNCFAGIVTVLIGLLFVGFASCSNDDEPAEVKDVVVSVSGTTGAPIVVTGIPDPEEVSLENTGFRSYLSKYKTDKSYVNVSAKCDDMKSRIDIKVWVNDKLVKQVSGFGGVATDNVRL